MKDILNHDYDSNGIISNKKEFINKLNKKNSLDF